MAGLNRGGEVPAEVWARGAVEIFRLSVSDKIRCQRRPSAQVCAPRGPASMDQVWGCERIPLEVCRRLMLTELKIGPYTSGIC